MNRSMSFRMRMTPLEYRKLEEGAFKVGVSKSQYVRMKLGFVDMSMLEDVVDSSVDKDSKVDRIMKKYNCSRGRAMRILLKKMAEEFSPAEKNSG